MLHPKAVGYEKTNIYLFLTPINKLMKKEEITKFISLFDTLKHQEKSQDIEFWLARDLQKLLGYSEWKNFNEVINKAKKSCEASKNNVSSHFVDVNKMGVIGLNKECILADFLPTITIKAKDFATEITNFNVNKENLQGEQSITSEHINNNKAVRQTLTARGIYPEELPIAEDIKKLERKLKSDGKKLGKGNFKNKGL